MWSYIPECKFTNLLPIPMRFVFILWKCTFDGNDSHLDAHQFPLSHSDNKSLSFWMMNFHNIFLPLKYMYKTLLPYLAVVSHCETSIIRIWYTSNLQLNGENWLQKMNRYLCFKSIIFSYITYFMRCHEPSKCVWPSNCTIMYKLILRFAK